MKIIETLTSHREFTSPCILTFGNFDGVHKGHQALFDAVKQEAKKQRLNTCVCTFTNHPVEVLSPDTDFYRLTGKEQKAHLLQAAGFDAAIIIPFTQQIADMTPEAFIEALARMIPIHTILVGHDVAFGKNRAGDDKTLVMLGRKFGCAVQFMEPVIASGERISSTRIRKLVRSASLQEVMLLLGRPYSIYGPIVKGVGAAKEMNYPTLNMQLDRLAYPKEGIYAVRVRFDKDHEFHLACAYIGQAKTLHPRPKPLLEVHLLEGNVLKPGSSVMEVEFHAFLRADQVFHSKKELIEQIERDVDQVKKIFNKYREER